MKHKLGEEIELRFLNEDKALQQIPGFTPSMTIRHHGKYFNGVLWEDSKSLMEMELEKNNTFILPFLPDKTGRYDCEVIGTNSEVLEKFSFYAYDAELVEHPVSAIYMDNYRIRGTKKPVVYVLHEDSKEYLYEDGYCKEKKPLQVVPAANSEIVISFIPTKLGKHIIEIEDDKTHLFEINVVEKLGLSYTFLDHTYESPQGDLRVIDNNNKPLASVMVSVYKSGDTKPVAIAYTDHNGEWEVHIPENQQYTVVFTKDSYVSVSKRVTL